MKTQITYIHAGWLVLTCEDDQKGEEKILR